MLKKYFRGISFYILLFAVILIIFTLYTLPETNEVTNYSDLVRLIQQGQVKEFEVIDRTVIATLITDNKKVEVVIPSLEILYMDVGEEIGLLMKSDQLETAYREPSEPPWWITILPTLGLVVIFILFWGVFPPTVAGRWRK